MKLICVINLNLFYYYSRINMAPHDSFVIALKVIWQIKYVLFH